MLVTVEGNRRGYHRTLQPRWHLGIPGRPWPTCLWWQKQFFCWLGSTPSPFSFRALLHGPNPAGCAQPGPLVPRGTWECSLASFLLSICWLS